MTSGPKDYKYMCKRFLAKTIYHLQHGSFLFSQLCIKLFQSKLANCPNDATNSGLGEEIAVNVCRNITTV